MQRLLHVVTSPRGDASVSRELTTFFLDRYRHRVLDLQVDELDVWTADLPEFDPASVGAKYKSVAGDDLDADEDRVWSAVTAAAERFRRADRIVLGVPMWNWGYPYKLKQLIDLVSQRDLLFTWDGQQYGPLLDVPRALVVAVRGQGADAPSAAVGAAGGDHQVDQLRFWLQTIGVRQVDIVRADHTWDDQRADSTAAARNELTRLAAVF